MNAFMNIEFQNYKVIISLLSWWRGDTSKHKWINNMALQILNSHASSQKVN